MESKCQLLSANYKFIQAFGNNQSIQIQEQDVISSLKYDPSGEFICLGDKAGRIIVFRASNQCKTPQTTYDYYSEFQSHIRQFDPLNGKESCEEIIDISWLRPQGKYLKLLTTNSKTIKLWKAFQKINKKLLKGANRNLCMPKLQQRDPQFTAFQSFIFPSAHSSQIKSISHSYNQQYLLSTDEQRSFIWNLEKPTKPYVVNQVINTKKLLSKDISFTCSSMHPTCDSIFAYGMNKSQCGLGICDIRLSSSYGKIMNFGVQHSSTKNIFSDYMGSIKSVQITNNGRNIITRQYLNVKVWDIANTKKPVINVCVQQNLKSKLANLWQNDNINDKFAVSCSKDNSTIVTGNYNNCFHLLNLQNGINSQYQISYNKTKAPKRITPGKVTPLQKLDTYRKTSVLTYHPSNHSVAVASLNCFFIYSI